MIAQTVTLNTSEYPDEVLDRLVFALASKMQSLMLVERPMTKEEAAAFLKISYKTFERRLSKGHYPEEIIHWDGGVMLFFPSELVSAIKKH